MKKAVSLLLGMALLAGCASSPGVKVIEQSDSKPSWANISRTVFEDGGKMYFVGHFTADGDSRPSAVVRGASTMAQAMPLESISDDFMQQSGVTDDMHDSAAKTIVNTLRKNPPNIPGLQVKSSYYERVEIQGSNGSTKTEVRAYSLAECPIAEYNKAKSDALAKLKGDSKLKQELNSLMAEQRERVYGEGKNRAPASSN